MANRKLYDVIVVGAGLAGLSAAYQLTLAGRDTLVLEGSSRIGGRILSQRIAETVIDHGGQWINSTHSQFIHLSKTLGLQLEEHLHTGAHRFEVRGLINDFDGDLPKLSIGDKINFGWLTKKLNRAAVKDLDPERPWLSPEASQLDQVRFSQFLKDHLIAKRRYSEIKPIIEGHFLNGIDQISALQGILEWKEKDHQKFQLLGGTEQLPRKLAQEVDVLFRQLVKQIIRDGSFIEVLTQNDTFRGRQVIVALPPVQAAEIRYSPPISPSKVLMWDAITPGRIIKTTLIFEQPYWRCNAWSGKAFISGDSPFQFLIDAGTSQDERGIISTYSIGSHCIALEKIPQDEKKRVIINQALKILKGYKREEPLHFEICDWKCPPNGYGAYHIFPPGFLTNYEDHLIRPEQGISWASAEYDTIHRGSMEGAIRSGLRAARDILPL